MTPMQSSASQSDITGVMAAPAVDGSVSARVVVRREIPPSGRAAAPTPGLCVHDSLLAFAEGDAFSMTDLPCSSPENRSHPSPRCLGDSNLAAPPGREIGDATGTPFGQ